MRSSENVPQGPLFICYDNILGYRLSMSLRSEEMMIVIIILVIIILIILMVALKYGMFQETAFTSQNVWDLSWPSRILGIL